MKNNKNLILFAVGTFFASEGSLVSLKKCPAFEDDPLVALTWDNCNIGKTAYIILFVIEKFGASEGTLFSPKKGADFVESTLVALTGNPFIAGEVLISLVPSPGRFTFGQGLALTSVSFCRSMVKHQHSLL